MNNGKICISVCAKTTEEMIGKIRQAEEIADVIELRFDCLAPEELDKMTEPHTSKAVLATFRSPEQGGNRELSVDERLRFWSKSGGGWASDLEEDILNSVSVTGKKIASFHDFNGVPSDLDSIFERLAASDADAVKIAVSVRDITDAIPLWKLFTRARTPGKQFVPIAMGEAGVWTRILGPAHGALLTYASLGSGDETAPGQILGSELVDLYRIKELSPESKVFGILGDPVSQSLSKFMHNPAFSDAGFDGVFIPFLVKDIDQFMQRMVRHGSREIELNFGGFSVTMPHKMSIMKHLDALDTTAANVGAVNTVKIEDGILTGSNTDAHGFITPLKAHFGDVRDARVAVCGAGGAARACVYALKADGARVEIFARDVVSARTLGRDFDVDSFELSMLRPGDFDILVNATPLGMSGELADKTLFTADQLEGVKFVYDLVTKPYDTPIVREARKTGIPSVGGVEMLVAQGAKQFEIWTGKPAPVALMRASILSRFSDMAK